MSGLGCTHPNGCLGMAKSLINAIVVAWRPLEYTEQNDRPQTEFATLTLDESEVIVDNAAKPTDLENSLQIFTNQNRLKKTYTTTMLPTPRTKVKQWSTLTALARKWNRRSKSGERRMLRNRRPARCRNPSPREGTIKPSRRAVHDIARCKYCAEKHTSQNPERLEVRDRRTDHANFTKEDGGESGELTARIKV